MTFLGRVAGAWRVLRSGYVPPVRNTLTAYEAAGYGRRARMWFSPQLGPNDAILGSVETLRQRSRKGVRDDGFARTAIDRLVSNIIGTGMVPESKAPDPAFRAAVHALWLDWTDEADADGVLDFYGMQALAVRSWLEGGDAFVRLRNRLPSDGLSVPLQLQLLEAEQCPVALTHRMGGRRIRGGIEVDALNRRLWYYMYQTLPADGSDLDTSRLVRVDADAVVHLYDPLRPGQLRGTPLLTQALIRLYEIDQYDDATIVRQKVAALFAGFIERQGTGDPDLNPFTGQPVESDPSSGEAILGMEPGILQELPVGDKMTFSNPPDATGYGEFMRTALMSASVAADVPYEVLTGDLRSVNDRTVRVILNEFRRRVEQRQHHIVAYQLNRKVWLAWLTRAITSGALDTPPGYTEDPLPWQRVEWIPAAWPYLHPVQDIEAYQKSVRAGVMNWSEVIKEVRGRSFEEVMAERAQEQEILDKLGIKLDSDPRVATATGLNPNPPEPAPRPAPVTNNHHTINVPPAPPPSQVEVHAPVNVHAPNFVDSRPPPRQRVVRDVIRNPETGRIERIVETSVAEEEAVP